MNKINSYFDTLATFFSEKDQDAFQEIKNDMLQDIDIQLKDGMTEEEIIANFGSPKEIADMYYAGINEDVLQRAKTSIIPTEEVKEEYDVIRKEKRSARIKKGVKIGKYTLITILSVVALYTLLVFLYLVLFCHTLLLSPIVISGIAVTLVIYLTNKKSLFGKISLGLIAVLVLLAFTNNVIYDGMQFQTTYDMDTQSLKNIFLSFNQDTTATLTLIPVDNESDSKIEINGMIENKDALTIEERNSTLKATSISSWFASPFIQKNNLSVYLYLPKDFSLEEFTMDFDNADVQLYDIHAGKIKVAMNSGQFHVTDVEADKIEVDGYNAEVSLKQFDSTIQYKGNRGSLILANGEGDVSVEADDGIVKFASIKSDNVSVQSIDAKAVIENTSIDNLQLNTVTGTVIMESQTGITSINNDSGKLVFRDNGGTMNITNKSGNVVAIQNTSIQGKVSNQSGTIKWVQNEKYPVDFVLKTEKDEIKYPIEKWRNISPTVEINSPEKLVTITTQ